MQISQTQGAVMSWWDDWGESAFNVVTGGIYGAAKAGTRAVAGAAGEKAEAEREQAEADRIRKQAVISGAGARPPLPSFPGARPAPAAVVADGEGGQCCCDRFQLEDGLLLDKTTGRVWEYDKGSRAFVFVPMKPAPEHEQIAGILLERDLAKITDNYTREVLSTLPSRLRATQLATFEKTYLEPLRAAIKSRKGGKST
jgi:hypothetical protein